MSQPDLSQLFAKAQEMQSRLAKVQQELARRTVEASSGGGMVTTYVAACDTRVRIAIPSCSFNSYVASTGKVVHCDCNMVPGILQRAGCRTWRD